MEDKRGSIDDFEGGIDKERINNKEIVDELTCPICQRVLWNPISCKNCENHFCSGCLDTWFKHNSENSCPNKCIYVKKKAAPILLSLISKLEVDCKNKEKGCKELVRYELLAKHQSNCDFNKIACEYCGKKMLLKDKSIHLESCSHFLIECSVCKEQIKRGELRSHDKITCLTNKINNLESSFSDKLAKQESVYKEQNSVLQKKVYFLESVVKKLASSRCAEGEMALELDFADQSELKLGIHRNVGLKSLLYSGWEIVYSKGYDHKSTNAELEEILDAYTIGSDNDYNVLICVGALNETEDQNNIILCGIDYLQVSLRKTKSLYEAKMGSNEIYWYWLEEKSFGFSPKKPIWLSCADHAEKYNNASRLSWCVHGTCGGSRLGKFSGLTEPFYKKIILIKVLE